MTERLLHETAAVTAAGRGRGRVVALAFAREGAKAIPADTDEANTLFPVILLAERRLCVMRGLAIAIGHSEAFRCCNMQDARAR